MAEFGLPATLATVRESIGAFVGALTLVYTILILVAVLLSIYQQMGRRIPYSRPMRAVLDFLDEVTTPVLAFFRRFVPMVGPFDLSPLVAVLVIGIAGNLLSAAIAG